MDEALLLARIIHIVLGIFWVGTMVFLAVFLLPSVREAGLAGGGVVAGLARRRFMLVFPITAVLAILSGLWLYWRVSAGFDLGFMRSGMGISLGIGGVAALLGFIIGATVVRGGMEKAGTLARSAAAASPDEREAILSALSSTQRRTTVAARIVAALLVGATIAMAVARYV